MNDSLNNAVADAIDASRTIPFFPYMLSLLSGGVLGATAGMARVRPARRVADLLAGGFEEDLL